VTNGFTSFNNTNSFAIADAGKTLTFDNTNGGAALIVISGSSNSIAAPVSLNDNLAVSVFTNTSMAISNVISSTSPSYGVTVGSGAGTLALYGNNTYGPAAGSVGTTILGSGTLELGNNNALGAGDVSIFNSSTIRAGTTLTVANNITVSNTTTATIDNNGNNITLSGVISGGGALGKNGAGTLTLSGANTFTNGVNINAGTIKLGNTSGIPGNTGNGNVNMGTNTTLDLNGFSPVLNGLNASATAVGATVDSLSGGAVTLTLGESGSFATFYGNIKNTSGSLALVKDGTGNQTLAGTNTYTGGTTINAGLLRVGNGNTNSAAGLGTGPVVNNGTLEFNLAGTNTFTNTLSGIGILNLANTNLTLKLFGNNSAYTGDINVNLGSLWITNSAAIGTGPKTITAVGGGNSLFTQIHLDGSLANINLNSSIGFSLSQSIGVLINEAGSNTISGTVSMPNGGGNPYIVVNSGFLTLAGPVTTVALNNPRNLTLGGAGNGLLSGVVSDAGLPQAGLTKNDSGTWTVTSVNTASGIATVNGGTLKLDGQWAGPVVVATGGTLTGTGFANSNLTVSAGGKFVPGGYGSVGSFTVSNTLSLAGTMYASINKSLVQSNTFVNVLMTGFTNIIASSGSSLIVSNLGPALAGGDKFFLFSQAVTNGNLIAITAPTGVTLTNNLAVDGSISVVPTVATNPTNLTATVVGNQLILSWPADHTGWSLQAQTNSLATGLSTNWVTIPGSGASNSLTNTIDNTNGSVFYRMIYP
jgi:autotransporter-associated beta strand protein